MAAKAGDSSEGTSKVMKITELPIYEKPEVKVKLIPEEIGQYRQGISTVRTAVWDWMDSVEDTTNSVKDKYETGKSHTMSTVDFLSSDDRRWKTAVIGGSGLTAILAGIPFKMGRIRLTGLCLSVVAAATAVSYPRQTVDLAKQQYENIKDSISKKSS